MHSIQNFKLPYDVFGKLDDQYNGRAGLGPVLMEARDISKIRDIDRPILSPFYDPLDFLQFDFEE